MTSIFVIEAALSRLCRVVVEGKIPNMVPRPMGFSASGAVSANIPESLAREVAIPGLNCSSGSAVFDMQPQGCGLGKP